MTLPGLDVSSYQHLINWSKVAKSGKVWVPIRCVIGATGRDSYFVADAKGAEAAGLTVMAYGVAYPQTSSAIAEADALVGVADSVGGIHALVLDVEGAGVPPSVSVDALTTYIHEWFVRIESHGYIGILYTGASFLRTRIRAAEFRDKLLWLADYGVGSPPVIGGWHPTFWQYTSSGSVPGISGRVDLDVFFGSQADLQTLLNGGHYVATVLKFGDSGAEVKTLQENLNTILGTHIATDEVYGKQTSAAVKSFEQIYHLGVDRGYGIAGPQVLGKIAELLNAKQGAPESKSPAPAPESHNPAPSQPASNLAQDLATAQAALQKALQDANNASAAQIAQLQGEVKTLTGELDAEKNSFANYKSKAQSLADQIKSL